MIEFLKKLFGWKKDNRIKAEDIFDPTFFKQLGAVADTMKSLDNAMKAIEERNMTEVELKTWLQASWCQKQFDDLLLVHKSVMDSLNKKPFDKGYLDKRDRVRHDINQLQPVMVSTGLACAMLIEKEYGIEFVFLTGKKRPLPKQEEPKPEETTTRKIILPREEKG